MRLTLSFIVLLCVLGSCGKKSDPEYEKTTKKHITIIQ